MKLTTKQLKQIIKEELENLLHEAYYTKDFQPSDLKGGYRKYKKKLRAKRKDMMSYLDELYQFDPNDWIFDEKLEEIDYAGGMHNLSKQRLGYMDKLRVAKIGSHPELETILDEINRAYNECKQRSGNHPATRPVRRQYTSTYPATKKEWGVEKTCGLGAIEAIARPWLNRLKGEAMNQWAIDNTPENARLAFKANRPRGIFDPNDDFDYDNRKFE